MQSVDLNLIRVLDAVLSCGSVTTAAERLHLSVSATSHALSRLRESLGDPLMVRAGRRLVPTPRAHVLREPVAQWLAQGHAMFSRDRVEALAALHRCFVIRAPEGIAIAFGAALLIDLRQQMPHASLRFVPESTEEDGALRGGELDLDLGHFIPREPEVRTRQLMQQRSFGLVRTGHPLASRTVTARRFVEHLHVDVQRRPGVTAAVDDSLASRGLARQVVLTVPQSNVAALMAARSDLVATLTERMARAMASAIDLQVLTLPFAMTTEPLVMAWHPRHDADPAHTLLRQQLLKVLATASDSTGLATRGFPVRRRQGR